MRIQEKQRQSHSRCSNRWYLLQKSKRSIVLPWAGYEWVQWESNKSSSRVSGMQQRWGLEDAWSWRKKISLILHCVLLDQKQSLRELGDRALLKKKKNQQTVRLFGSEAAVVFFFLLFYACVAQDVKISRCERVSGQLFFSFTERVSCLLCSYFSESHESKSKRSDARWQANRDEAKVTFEIQVNSLLGAR